MKTLLNKKSGFTIVELMVTITVMGIIFGTGMAAYLNFNKTQTVKQAGLKLKNDLRDAQGKALSGIKDCSICRGADLICNTSDDLPLNGWEFQFSPTSYQYALKCGILNGTWSVVTLPTGFSITTSPAGLIRFKALGQGADFDAVGVTQRTICLSGYGKLYKLIVTVSGEIQDHGIVTACP